jgi:hypothetical protein
MAAHEDESERNSEPEDDVEEEDEASNKKQPVPNGISKDAGKAPAGEERSTQNQSGPTANGNVENQKEKDAEPIEEAGDDEAHHSEPESELEVQSKEQHPVDETQAPVKKKKMPQQQRQPQSQVLPEPEREQPVAKQQPQQRQVQTPPKPQHEPKPQAPKARQPQQQFQQLQQQNQQVQGPQPAKRAEGYRPAAVRESRIKDRPAGSPAGNSALKIKIELDLEVEVDLYARVKGDVTIGLM